MSTRKARPVTHPPRQPRGAKPGQKVIRERQAAQRALAAASGARAARRRRLLTVLGPVGAVVLLVALLVTVKVVTGSGEPKSGKTASAADAAVVAQVTRVPAATLDAVAAGKVTAAPKAISDALATRDGKPFVLYIGAEYCPYCAAERWPVIVALSRFGTWSNLSQSSSPPAPEAFPNTATFTFHGASYRSDYLTFTGVETASNQVSGSQYKKLDTVSAADQAIMEKHNSAGNIPFVYIGGKYVIEGATFDPGVLSGKTHAQIATALADANSSIAKSVDGAANAITATVCTVTNNQPSAVCTAPGVVKAKQALGNAG